MNKTKRETAWRRWVDKLICCPRISTEQIHRFTNDILPVSDCSCHDCELWREADLLRDEYRQICGFST